MLQGIRNNNLHFIKVEKKMMKIKLILVLYFRIQFIHEKFLNLIFPPS